MKKKKEEEEEEKKKGLHIYILKTVFCENNKNPTESRKDLPGYKNNKLR